MSRIKSFSVGNGDMFYIDHNSDNFTTIDCCYEDEETRDAHFEEMQKKASKKGIKRFISTHPDEDHIKGIRNFCETVGIINFYVVENETKKSDETDSFKKYRELRDDPVKAYYVYKGCRRRWMNQGSEERNCAGINFLWPDRDNTEFKNALLKAKEGTEFNNISPIFTYSVEDGIKAMWMGDMETDFLDKIKDTILWPEIDILFALHHGRESGKVSSDVLKKLNPQIIVIGEALSKDLNYYSGYNTITQNSAGDIIFECTGSKTHVYVSNYNYNVSYLDDDKACDESIGHYLGSFTPRGAK